LLSVREVVFNFIPESLFIFIINDQMGFTFQGPVNYIDHLV